MTAEETARPATTATPPPRVNLIWRVVRVISTIVSALWFDLKVYDRQNIPADGGVLLVSNHQSYLDPVLLAVKLRRPMSYLARADLFEKPAFAWLIRSLNAIPLKRSKDGKGDKGAIEETIRRLQEGHILAIFAEGTRTENGEIGPIQRGIALMVRRAAVPIVPVVIDGSFQAWPKGQKLFHPHPIGVLYGPPLQIEGLKGDAIVELIDKTLHRMLGELRWRMART